MKKILFKYFLFFLILLIGLDVSALTHSVYTNEDTGYKVIIEDDAELLREDELARLYSEMIPLTQYGNIIFKTINSNDSSAQLYARRYYYAEFGNKSGTLFLIDMDNRMIYIFSDGSNYKYITSDKANIITDNVYRYATNQQYYDCASVAFSQILTTLQGDKIAEPMRYISNGLISLTFAFFISFIVVLINTNIRKATNAEILKNCGVSFSISNVKAVKTGQSRKYSPQSSSSGGSSGGGGGGGGSSSGGGGGHRF